MLAVMIGNDDDVFHLATSVLFNLHMMWCGMLWWDEVDGHFEGFLLLSGCVLRASSGVFCCLLLCCVLRVLRRRGVCCLLLCHYFVGRGFIFYMLMFSHDFQLFLGHVQTEFWCRNQSQNQCLITH